MTWVISVDRCPCAEGYMDITYSSAILVCGLDIILRTKLSFGLDGCLLVGFLDLLVACRLDLAISNIDIVGTLPPMVLADPICLPMRLC